MKKFEVGKKYTHGWIGNSDLFTTWEVIARTEKTITIKDGDEIRKCRINKWYLENENREAVLPYGSYSMCPVLKAS